MLSHKKDETEAVLNQGLMFHCLNWGEPGCRPEILEFFDSKKTCRGDQDTVRLPTVEELKKLNDMCRVCHKAYLEIYKKECPACGSDKIVEGFAPNFNDRAGRKPRFLYPYYCVACGKYLFSADKL